jgi:hypothetical protein
MPEPRFADVELMVKAVLDPLSGGRVNDATPPDLESRMPFQRVERIGGADDGVTDDASVDVEAFAGTRAEAWALAEDQRQLLLDGRHGTEFGLIDHVRTVAGPSRRPWDNPKVHRFGATYRITARR